MRYALDSRIRGNDWCVGGRFHTISPAWEGNEDSNNLLNELVLLPGKVMKTAMTFDIYFILQKEKHIK